jgi:hypothetical protein
VAEEFLQDPQVRESVPWPSTDNSVVRTQRSGVFRIVSPTAGGSKELMVNDRDAPVFDSEVPG